MVSMSAGEEKYLLNEVFAFFFFLFEKIYKRLIFLFCFIIGTSALILIGPRPFWVQRFDFLPFIFKEIKYVFFLSFTFF